MGFRELAQPFLDVFFPKNCVHCGDPVEESEYSFFCRNCSRGLILSESPNCHTCGYPFEGMIAGPRICPHCVELNPFFDEGKTLFLAKGPARSIIHELKYRSGFYVLEDIRIMIRKVPGFESYFKDAVLVPVPLYRTRLRERGFNQSECIARMLVETTGALKMQKLLCRNVFRQSQTRLSQSARRKNVKNVFALTSDAVLLTDRTYILVDDVFTTGSTLNACAEVLRNAGANRLKIATLAHG